MNEESIMQNPNEADYLLACDKPLLNDSMKWMAQGKEVWAKVTSIEELNEYYFDNIKYIFFLYWSHRVPDEILKKVTCVCFHMTDLPYGRGGSPLQNLILNGHKDSMLSAIRMTNELDAGPIYLKEAISLSGNASDVYHRAAIMSQSMIRKIIDEELQPKEQTGVVTKFKRRIPNDSEITDVINSGEKLYDFIRMLDGPGLPCAFIKIDKTRLEFKNARLESLENEEYVTVSIKVNKHDQVC